MGVSSIVGVVSVPLIGLYCATKWALEAMHEALAQELRPHGVHVTLLEPGAYATGFATPQSLKFSPNLAAYEAQRPALFQQLASMPSGRMRALQAL